MDSGCVGCAAAGGSGQHKQNLGEVCGTSETTSSTYESRRITTHHDESSVKLLVDDSSVGARAALTSLASHVQRWKHPVST
eukprot:1195511-Prorocentrum_minimum.AAC.7